LEDPARQRFVENAPDKAGQDSKPVYLNAARLFEKDAYYIQLFILAAAVLDVQVVYPPGQVADINYNLITVLERLLTR